MVLTTPSQVAPGALAFGGANGRQVGQEWYAQQQAGAAPGRQQGPGSPYAKPPRGAGRRRKGKADSWGTRPIDLFWNERASEERARSPGSARAESVDAAAGTWESSLQAPDEAVRRAAMRLESSTAVGPTLRGALPTLVDGRAASVPPGQGPGSPPRPAVPPARFLASPALAAQSSIGADPASLQRKAAMMNLPWKELPVSAASYPAHGMQLKRAATKKGGKTSKPKKKKPLPHKTMEWLASRHRMDAAENVQPALDKILRGDTPPKEPPPPKAKKKKKKKSRAARARAKERALKRQQALEMQQAISGGVDAEVKRWKDMEKARGKEMVSQEKYLAWHAKWTDGGRPTEQEWQEFFNADTDGDGVLSHAELAEFAERKDRGVSAERADFWKIVVVVGTRVRVKGELGVVIKGPDEDDDVAVRWDKDDSETFVKRIELRYENMADANHFFYNPDSELEYIKHNQASIARKAVADLEAAHAAQLEEAERKRLEAEEAERAQAEQEAGWGSDDEENEFASYVHSLHQQSTPDLAGWAPMESGDSPRGAAAGSHYEGASWRASLERPAGSSYAGSKPRRPGPGASFELSLSYAAVDADHREMEKEETLDPIAAVSNVLKTTNKNHVGADPEALIPLSKNDVSISRHPVESPTKLVLDHLKHSGVPKSAREKLREALEDFDTENPPAEKLADWRLAVPAEGREDTSITTRPAVVMDPQARQLLMDLTPKPQYRSKAERSRRRMQLRDKRRPAERYQQQTVYSELSVAAGGNEGWADSLREDRPRTDPLEGDDARSVFALRQSGRYRVGEVGHVQWERGWYSVVIEEVAANAPKVRISYLAPYDAYTAEDDWKHFWEVHFDEEAAAGAAATRAASAQRVAMYRQVKREKEEEADNEAHCREFARQWIVSDMLKAPIAGALSRGYHSGVPHRPPTPKNEKKPWMNEYARPLSAEVRPEAGLAAATRVARPWTPLPKAPPPPEPEPEEEPWLEEERAVLMANVSVHGATNWVQRAYELGTYRTPEEVEKAWIKFDEEERELAQLRAKLEAEAEARRLALDAAEAQRKVEEAQALQLYDEAAIYTEKGDFKRAYEALVPASALAPDHTGIAAALDRAMEKYEAWLAATEEVRRKQQEAKDRREKALKLAATKASHPMQWAVFRQIDTSGDGLLQADEIRAYMTELGQPEMATQLLEALDRDGDGDVDFPEFCAGWERWLASNSVGTNDHLSGS